MSRIKLVAILPVVITAPANNNHKSHFSQGRGEGCEKRDSPPATCNLPAAQLNQLARRLLLLIDAQKVDQLIGGDFRG